MTSFAALPLIIIYAKIQKVPLILSAGLFSWTYSLSP